MLTLPPSITVTQPATEPLTLAEVKRQIAMSANDASQDAELAGYIKAARIQFEHDTASFCISRTLQLVLPEFDELTFAERPVSAITSITYYDSSNALQTLATSVYALDQASRKIRLKYNQSWPAITGRWDAVTVNYTAGQATDSTQVDQFAKQAMLLLVCYYYEQRGDNDRQYDLQAYDRLVARYMRSSYP